MKKIFLTLVVAIVSLFSVALALAYFVAGYSPVYLYNAPTIATGIGARLACSMHYVTGYEEDRTAEDIEVYSPILSALDYQYDDVNKSVSASLLGIKTRSATFLPGIGCALDYSQTNHRATIDWPNTNTPEASWPKGNGITSINPVIQEKLDSLLKADNNAGHDTRALVVVHDGAIVAETYADGIDANTQLLGWSMTKSVNALVLGHLEMLGKIDIKESGFFPEWQGDNRSNITVEDLLHMADGLDYSETYDPGQPAVTMLFDSPDVANFMLKRKLINQPGSYYEYSSGTANLISYLIQQRIEGDVRADAYWLAGEFFNPLGIDSAIYETDPSGLFMGSSYLYATARDWAKVGQLMLNGGQINGKRLVTEDFIKRALTPNNTVNKPDYGYQWWLNRGAKEKRWPDLPANAYAAMGNREQRVMVIPNKKLVIVRLGWSADDYPDSENFNQIQQWVE